MMKIMKGNMNKKGSHAGVIISFVIFITSLLFIFSMIGSPFNVGADKKISIDLLHSNVIDMVSYEMAIVRIANNSDSFACIEFNTPDNELEILEVIALDSSGNQINVSTSGMNTFVDGVNGFTKLFYSENESFTKTMDRSVVGCTPINVSSIVSEDFIMEGNFVPLADRIDNDYNTLKSELGISLDEEFDVIFELNDGTEIPDRGDVREAPMDIYAKEYIIQYISMDGKVEAGKMVVKIW